MLGRDGSFKIKKVKGFSCRLFEMENGLYYFDPTAIHHDYSTCPPTPMLIYLVGNPIPVGAENPREALNFIFLIRTMQSLSLPAEWKFPKWLLSLLPFFILAIILLYMFM